MDASRRQIKAVVFDLDGPLVESTTAETGPDRSPTDPENFRWVDFAPEVIDRLSQAGYKISFFSDGERERDTVLITRLQEMILNRTGHVFRPYRTFHREDMTPVFGRAETAPC